MDEEQREREAVEPEKRRQLDEECRLLVEGERRRWKEKMEQDRRTWFEMSEAAGLSGLPEGRPSGAVTATETDG